MFHGDVFCSLPSLGEDPTKAADAGNRPDTVSTRDVFNGRFPQSPSVKRSPDARIAIVTRSTGGANSADGDHTTDGEKDPETRSIGEPSNTAVSTTELPVNFADPRNTVSAKALTARKAVTGSADEDTHPLDRVKVPVPLNGRMSACDSLQGMTLHRSSRACDSFKVVSGMGGEAAN
jgi:hypothetical protein